MTMLTESTSLDSTSDRTYLPAPVRELRRGEGRVSRTQKIKDNGMDERTTEQYGIPASREVTIETGQAGVTGEIREDSTIPTVKFVSRSVVCLTSDDEYKIMLEQHSDLAMRKVTSGLSREEKMRLDLIKWNIDQIEDAKYGHSLDALESIVKTHENIANRFTQSIKRFDSLVVSYNTKNRRASRRR